MSSYLTRELPTLTPTLMEKKQLDIMFGNDAISTTLATNIQAFQPQKSNRYFPLVPGKFYRRIIIDSYSYKVKDYIQLVTGDFGRIEAISVAHGSTRVVITKYPTHSAIDDIANIHKDNEVLRFKTDCYSSNIPIFSIHEKNSPLINTIVSSSEIRCKALYCCSNSFSKYIFTSLYLRARYE